MIVIKFSVKSFLMYSVLIHLPFYKMANNLLIKEWDGRSYKINYYRPISTTPNGNNSNNFPFLYIVEFECMMVFRETQIVFVVAAAVFVIFFFFLPLSSYPEIRDGNKFALRTNGY